MEERNLSEKQSEPQVVASVPPASHNKKKLFAFGIALVITLIGGFTVIRLRGTTDTKEAAETIVVEELTPTEKLPELSPTQIPTVEVTTRITAAPKATATPTITPTSSTGSIRVAFVEDRTGNPLPGQGIKVTLKGNGVDKMIENTNEATFTDLVPGTYEVVADNPSGYMYAGSNCASDCVAFSSEAKCARRLPTTAGNSALLICQYTKR